MSFSAFKTLLKDWIWNENNADLDARVAFISQMAEARLNRDLRVRDMLTSTNLTFTPPAYPQIPADYLEAYSVVYGESESTTTEKHRYVSPDQWNDLQDWNRYPGCYYTIWGSDIRLYPVPAVVDSGTQYVTLDYYQRVPSFSATDASWVYTKHPDLYLYACLAEAADYLKDRQDIPVYEQKYQNLLMAVKRSDLNEKYSGSRLVMRNFRSAV